MSKFKVGDTVYNILEGIGVVTSMEDSPIYPFRVNFKNGSNDSFTADGKSVDSHVNPSLLTLEEARTKGYDIPKQKVIKTRTGWVNVYENSQHLYEDKETAVKSAFPEVLDTVEVTFEYEVEE